MLGAVALVEEEAIAGAMLLLLLTKGSQGRGWPAVAVERSRQPREVGLPRNSAGDLALAGDGMMKEGMLRPRGGSRPGLEEAAVCGRPEVERIGHAAHAGWGECARDG